MFVVVWPIVWEHQTSFFVLRLLAAGFLDSLEVGISRWGSENQSPMWDLGVTLHS